MRPSSVFVLLSILTSFVGASKGAKGYETVGFYYAYSLERLAHNKDPTYVRTLAAGCYGTGDCSTFARFLETVLEDAQKKKAKGILKSGGPLDTNNPGDEAAEAFNKSTLSGSFDEIKMYGKEVAVPDYSSKVKKISDAVDRAGSLLGSEGQDIIDKIAHDFEEVVKARNAELSDDKITDIKKNNPKMIFVTMANNPKEIDWEATIEANPNFAKKSETTRNKFIERYNLFDGLTRPVHVAAIDAATNLVNRLRSPRCV